MSRCLWQQTMFSRREKAKSPVDAVITALKGWQSDIWTALPGVIQNVYGNQSCDVKPALQMPYYSPESGEVSWLDIPMLLDCPMQFPGSGGVTLTFPVKKGDECLVIFSSRCIDTWWQSGGVKNTLPDIRMHDLSDGFVLLGFRSVPQVVPNISTTEAQLRTNDGNNYIGINPSTGKVTIKADIDIIGNFDHSGGSMTSLGKKIDGTHTHSNVQNGPDNTAAPNP